MDAQVTGCVPAAAVQILVSTAEGSRVALKHRRTTSSGASDVVPVHGRHQHHCRDAQSLAALLFAGDLEGVLANNYHHITMIRGTSVSASYAQGFEHHTPRFEATADDDWRM